MAKKGFKCKSEAQKKAIRASYAKEAKRKSTSLMREHPNFPFWARLKIYKNRPALVIDEEPAFDKSKKRYVDGFVHRVAIHTKGRGELIEPNPNPNDERKMYLRHKEVKPKTLFKKFNQNWRIPKELQERYEKNNEKEEKKQ